MDSGVQAAKFRAGEVAAGGMRLPYREAGSGPALVCIVGSDGISPAHGLLAAHHRVVVFDGADTRPETAASIGEAVAALGIAAPFDLAGHGAAVRVALRLALEQAKSVRALVLLGPSLIARDGTPADAADAALLGRLGGLALPILALFGSKDDAAPIETARHYRALMPACNLVYVYDAGAAMAAERPEAVASLVGDFLERHDLFLVRRDSDVIHP